MGKNNVETKQWPDKRYGDSAPGKSTITDWYAEFKRGRTNTDDASDGSSTSETSETSRFLLSMSMFLRSMFKIRC